MGLKAMDDSYYAQKAAEIAASFSYDGYRVARRELFAHTRTPAVTIRYDSLTFNTACISGLEDAVYIELMVSQDEKRIAIKKSEENYKDSLRWCIAKPDKRKSRKMVGPKFTHPIYELMGWDPNCRYKVIGYKIEYKGEYVYVFELTEPDIYHEKPKRTKEETEELKNSMSDEEYSAFQKKEREYTRTPFYPDDVENTFGVPVKEHVDQITLGDKKSYKTAGEMSETGEKPTAVDGFSPDSDNTLPGNTSNNSDASDTSQVVEEGKETGDGSD